MSSHTILWYAERAAVKYLVAMAEFWAETEAWQRGIANAKDSAWSAEARTYRGRENREEESMEGQESSLKIRPCIICSVTAAQAVLEHYAGLWTPKLDVQVEANRATSTGDDADEMASTVFDLLLTTTAIPDLSGATPGFSVRDVIPQDVSLRAEGRAWVTQMSFSLEQANRA